jgi:hypothetical protein
MWGCVGEVCTALEGDNVNLVVDGLTRLHFSTKYAYCLIDN